MPGQCLLPQLSIVEVEVGRLHPQKRQLTGPFLSTRCQLSTSTMYHNEKAELNSRELSLSHLSSLLSLLTKTLPLFLPQGESYGVSVHCASSL
eukprot:scaffold88369_cov45-Cyclotella_meneghiniana.AAC.1